MSTLLFNALGVIVGLVILLAVFYFIPQFFLHKCTKKQFLDKYGKFIGKKGFFDTRTNQFLDENKHLLLDLPESNFVRIFGVNGLIPCILQEDTRSPYILNIFPRKFTVDFEVKYVGEITVLYHPEYGEITYPTEKFKTKPTINSSIQLHGNADNRLSYWQFSWSED